MKQAILIAFLALLSHNSQAGILANDIDSAHLIQEDSGLRLVRVVVIGSATKDAQEELKIAMDEKLQSSIPFMCTYKQNSKKLTTIRESVSEIQEISNTNCITKREGLKKINYCEKAALIVCQKNQNSEGIKNDDLSVRI